MARYPKARRSRGGDPPAVLGGRGDSARFLRKDLDFSNVPADPLGKHIGRLFVLHPNVAARFGNPNLYAMDEAAKRALLDEINAVLGIRPFRKREA